ncbi:MAG: 5'-nucleotidase C-terminal domain-containing protein [Clostridiales bacterium]|nr:5'-nucleotidase C-terminal domain-containing protein [Clostridiales bacterium]
MKRALILLLCLCLLTALGETRVLVVETTDIHGYIMDVSAGSYDRIQYRLARIAFLVNRARESGEYDGVLLLDGGDLYQGAPVSLMTGGAVIRAELDKMGYDAVGLGNHEFDWDAAEYAGDQEGTLPPYELGDCLGDPKIPVLAGGLYERATGQRAAFTRDYAVVEKAGKRIAVIGYIPDYRNSIMTSKIAPYYIDSSMRSLGALVRRVNETERPDATVILAHCEPIAVAEAMDPAEVQLVCGGHSHDIKTGVASNGITYIQGNCYAYGFASAVLVLGEDGSVRAEDPSYTDVYSDRSALYDTPETAPGLDPDIMDISRACWDAIQEGMSEVLGYIETPVVGSRAVGASSAGNWITSLMLRATRAQGTVAAFYNSGGIRASFKLARGEASRAVTVADVYSMLPFGNKLLVFDISGQELARQLANALKQPNHGDQVSGLTFTYSAAGDPGADRDDREYTVLTITLDDGTQVDLSGTDPVYRVCTCDFNATVPGSVFAGKAPVVPEADAPTDNEAVIKALRELAGENGGYIPVDESPRGTEVAAEATETESTGTESGEAG